MYIDLAACSKSKVSEWLKSISADTLVMKLNLFVQELVFGEAEGGLSLAEVQLWAMFCYSGVMQLQQSSRKHQVAFMLDKQLHNPDLVSAVVLG